MAGDVVEVIGARVDAELVGVGGGLEGGYRGLPLASHAWAECQGAGVAERHRQQAAGRYPVDQLVQCDL